MDLFIKDLNVQVENLPLPILSIPYLHIPARSQVAILGPSGCGKTTLLNTISGLINIQARQLLWGNTDLTQLSAAKRDIWRFTHIGIVLQEFYLTSGLSALENVLLPYSFTHWRISNNIKQRAKMLLEQMGFTRFHSPAERLSRGEMQRIAIARALLLKPNIILADEPTASLDLQNAKIIAQLLPQLSQQEQCTLIVTTHDLNLAEHFSRQIYLANGQIEREEALC